MSIEGSIPMNKRAQDRSRSLRCKADLTEVQVRLLSAHGASVTQIFDMPLLMLQEMYPSAFAIEQVISDAATTDIQDKENRIYSLVERLPKHIRDAVAFIAVAMLTL